MTNKVEVVSLHQDYHGRNNLTLVHESNRIVVSAKEDEMKPMDLLKYGLCLLFGNDRKEEVAICRMSIDELKIKYDIRIHIDVSLTATQWDDEFKYMTLNFPGIDETKEQRVTELVQALLSDINTRALHKHQQGDSWTIDDCKKGADLGRSVIEQIKALM